MTAFPAHSLIKLPSVCQPACFLILFQTAWCRQGLSPVWSYACTPHLSLGSEQEQSQVLLAASIPYRVACIFKGSKGAPHSCSSSPSRRSSVPFEASPD